MLLWTKQVAVTGKRGLFLSSKHKIQDIIGRGQKPSNPSMQSAPLERRKYNEKSQDKLI